MPLEWALLLLAAVQPAPAPEACPPPQPTAFDLNWWVTDRNGIPRSVRFRRVLTSDPRLDFSLLELEQPLDGAKLAPGTHASKERTGTERTRRN